MKIRTRLTLTTVAALSAGAAALLAQGPADAAADRVHDDRWGQRT